MLGRIIRHIREGTWAEGISMRMNRWLAPYIASANRKARERNGVHRFNILNKDEAVMFLSQQATYWHGIKATGVLIAGNKEDPHFKALYENLHRRGLHAIHFHGKGASIEPSGVDFDSCCIISSYFTAKENHELILAVSANGKLKDIPFEYVGDALTDYEAVRKHSVHESLHFISPILIDQIPYLDIYEYSLTKFEKKCEIRDYMDLCQAISHVTRQNVPGDVCEFGSFKGHSGYLISRLLEEEKSDKRLYMFDMFEHFPEESAGVDAFWSQTHAVDFEEVKSKFSERRNVTLIKGDFTQTLSSAGLGKLSLIYVDCDSYRATLFLMKELFEQKLSVKGMMIFEDYGHPALLGNRLAVHEFFDKRKDCIKFFSQFSGYYIVIKTS